MPRVNAATLAKRAQNIALIERIKPIAAAYNVKAFVDDNWLPCLQGADEDIYNVIPLLETMFYRTASASIPLADGTTFAILGKLTKVAEQRKEYARAQLDTPIPSFYAVVVED